MHAVRRERNETSKEKEKNNKPKIAEEKSDKYVFIDLLVFTSLCD